jgi:hypothetical protein
VIAQPTPPIIDVITPAPAIDPASLYVIPPDYSPSALNVGTVRAYKNERRTAVVTIKAKFDETITAQLKPAGPFQITRLTSYKYGMPMVSIQSVGATPLLKVRSKVQSVAGNQGLPVKAGQEVDVEVVLTGAESLPVKPGRLSMRRGSLERQRAGERVRDAAAGDHRRAADGRAQYRHQR